MDKSIVLARLDDVCTEIYLDIPLNVKTHKMALSTDLKVTPRPIHQKIEKVHRSMYDCAVSEHSRVRFVLCDYIPDHNLYQSLMVVSKCFIKKMTTLLEVGGHHFKFGKELIIAGTLHCLLYVNIFNVLKYFYVSLLGVNDFSIIYSGKPSQPHLLLGPIAFVNHSCAPNCIFLPHEDGKTYLKAVENIKSGEEITVQYSTEYFGDSCSKCLCKLCSTVYDRQCNDN